jgi:hypothetical protein
VSMSQKQLSLRAEVEAISRWVRTLIGIAAPALGLDPGSLRSSQ